MNQLGVVVDSSTWDLRYAASDLMWLLSPDAAVGVGGGTVCPADRRLLFG
jgi:hypothetical protein